MLKTLGVFLSVGFEMSRRKQARPIRHLEDGLQPDGAPAPTGNDEPPSEDEYRLAEEELRTNGALMCPRCQEQITNVNEFLAHKADCARKAKEHADESTHSDPEDMVVSEDDDYDSEIGGKRLERMRRHRQDAANNNSVEESSPEENTIPRLDYPFPAAAGHVTLEALQNTKVAVAQFAATAMANNADNELALQDLAVLQSTLFTLQHQQVLQLQLINQLQQQLSINRSKASSPVSPHPENDVEPPPSESPPPLQMSTPQEISPVILPATHSQPSNPPEVIPKTPISEANIPLPPQIQPPMCSISSSLASSIITHGNDPPPIDEPNTLEMLQKRAQEVLDNASQGLLATNLADELAFRKSKGALSPYDSKGRNEPFFKHRCRYCGKVFGSDSALQIHIRSHTGERPYKCNVCGSRFTTKGNLKVHFQRHSAKFPHIKMNPNPVPEHLDKYHPPLLAQLGQQPSLSPNGPPHPPHIGFPPGHHFPPSSIPLYRPGAPHPADLLNNRLQPSPHRSQDPPVRLFPPHPLFLKRDEQDVPENLTKPPRTPTPNLPNQETTRCKSEAPEEKPENEPPITIPTLTPKQEMDTDNEPEQETERFSPVPTYDECSLDSKYSHDEELRRSPNGMDNSDNMQDEPENLSNKSSSITIPLSISTGQKLPANFPFGHASSPPSSTSSGSLGPFPSNQMVDPSKDPAIYTNLLPRPGSNDNSWESLIEITKTSETSKLQQLVDNIEHKLSDPNQCVICHRVLSCKSALQMHYRTHTGERPFKCKICGRAFTTKGNLKTHMGVHRAKPPMRVLHQCPVCHKKFTNALVLQQHIRLHTGEPTDLTPEQIQAAEVKDFPSPGGFPPLPNSMNPFLSQHFSGLSPSGPSGYNLDPNDKDFSTKSEQDFMDDDDDDDDDMSTSEQHMASFNTSPSDMQVQGINLNNMSASELSCSAEDLCSNRTLQSMSPVQNGDKSPTQQSEITSPGSSDIRSSPNQINTPVQVPRPPSSQQPGSPTPSESNSLGALDLTPKPHPPHLHSQISSPGPANSGPSLFQSFGLLPPGQGTPLLSTSALSSLTSSVLTSTAFSPLRLAVGPTVRGNTTCHLCFKTFACNSALEIHYRSHTKERPFKCTICDRGFSTKGNMKQHMLTHKIRDMPQHMFDKPSSVAGSDAQPPIPPCREPPPKQEPPVKQEPPLTPQPTLQQPLPPPQEPPKESPEKREMLDTELPLAKRPPSLQQSNKHLCHVCNKNFSSSSALQIHMRTHTGDKPFRCTVCQKAFTTKGNLKVHMGTHMWSNGASRRGRRMSLDLPPIPMTPKDSEFLQRRPDLFYPYLPAPFLNGMQQKINEIPVVQSPQNGLSGANKYSGLLGFGYPPPEALRSQASSPDRPASRPPSREPDRIWDLHFDRKPTTEAPPREELMPPNREGLAA